MPGSARPASSIARSGERRGLEEEAIAHGIAEQLETGARRATGRRSSAWSCSSPAEPPTRTWRRRLGISEQQVANFKFDFVARLRTLVKKQRLSEDVFPELYAEDAK